MSPVEITWLGQSALVVRMGADVVVIDVFLSPSDWRTYEAPPADLLPVDATTFLCSHMHGDHFDAPALRDIAARRTIDIVVPEPAVDAARTEVPAATIRGIAAGGSTRVGAMTINAIGVVHGDEPKSGYHDGAFLGFVIDAPGYPKVFHGGDCIPSEGLLAGLRQLRPQLLALPINGRDWYRERFGFVGNMSAEEAAITAIEAKAEVVMPLHYDAIKGNAADPADLVRHIQARGGAVSVVVPSRNKTFSLGVPA